MNLIEIFSSYGIGVMATAGADGRVNTAVYARPHLVDADTLVWGMTEGQTFRNISQNPHASYLFRQDMPGFRGIRLQLELLRSEEAGEMLEKIRQETSRIVGPDAGSYVTHAVWFRITGKKALI
jgi:hypothetical protein